MKQPHGGYSPSLASSLPAPHPHPLLQPLQNKSLAIEKPHHQTHLLLLLLLLFLLLQPALPLSSVLQVSRNPALSSCCCYCCYW
jgi:hypothetical protein